MKDEIMPNYDPTPPGIDALGPWQVGSTMVTIDVDNVNQIMTVMIPYQAVFDLPEDEIEQLWTFCETMNRRLKEGVKPGWKVK